MTSTAEFKPRTTWRISVVLAAGLIAIVGAAAPFQNLDFEDGVTTNVGGGGVAAPSVLLPGWQVTSGENFVVPMMGFDLAPFDQPQGFADVILLSTNNPNHFPVFGKFSLQLDPILKRDVVPTTASILQTGDLPIVRSPRF